MPRLNKPPSDNLLQEAVELRIGGHKWEIVAQKVKRAFNTVRKWPVRYAERWEVAVERAERRLSLDSNAESVLVLRNMLRADDLKMRWQAAKTLVGLRVDLGKLGLRILTARAAAGDPIDPAADQDFQLFRFLQQQSDLQLAEVAASLYPSLAPTSHGPAGHAGDTATCGKDSACVAGAAAHGQQGPDPTSKST